VPERKPRSGTILDFGPARRTTLAGGLRNLDSKKKAISMRLIFLSKTGKPYFEVFVHALTRMTYSATE
jgi:hypothetical protein